MRSIDLCGASALSTLLACSAGVPGTSDLTFGPVDPPPTTSDTNDSVDITTSGVGSSGDPDDTGRPPDDTGTMTGPDPTGEPDTGVEDSSTSSATTMSESSTTDPPPACGDGVIDMGEDCDSMELGGLSCPDVDPMYSGGTLACDASCMFDTSGCSTVANPIVECQMVNAAIPDNSAVGVTSTLMLPAEAVGLNITDVDVDVQLVHTYIGDLLIHVTHAGTQVVLHDNLCGTQEDIDTTYDDEAGAAFNCPQSASGLSFQPFGTLSTLDGVATQTNWTLFVEDQLGADTGTLQQWCVTISWM